MINDPSLLILQLEEEIISDKLKQGRLGIEFLLEHIDEDMDMYGTLLYRAGVKGNHRKSREFLLDSLTMTPEEFHSEYPVNYWLARSMNLQHLSNTCDALSPMYREYYIHVIAKRIREGIK